MLSDCDLSCPDSFYTLSVNTLKVLLHVIICGWFGIGIFLSEELYILFIIIFGMKGCILTDRGKYGS